MPETRMVKSNGLEFCVEERGDPAGEPLLLIMGLGAQLTFWPESLLERYVAEGYRVIRYDNRDIGLSSEVDAPLRGHPLKAMAQFRLGMRIDAPYSLHDHARDALGIMDALNIRSAHIKGVSMGGMIGQILAADYPERVRSLTLVMSSNNSPRLRMPRPDVIWWLQGGNIKGHDEEAVIARGLELWKRIQSPAYPRDLDATIERIRNNYQRSYRPLGIMRQMRGVLATGDLSPVTSRIRVPTIIVHGTADPLIRPDSARRLHRLIPDSRLHWVEGMGHDLPEDLVNLLADHTLGLARSVVRPG